MAKKYGSTEGIIQELEHRRDMMVSDVASINTVLSLVRGLIYAGEGTHEAIRASLNGQAKPPAKQTSRKRAKAADYDAALKLMNGRFTRETMAKAAKSSTNATGVWLSNNTGRKVRRVARGVYERKGR